MRRQRGHGRLLAPRAVDEQRALRRGQPAQHAAQGGRAERGLGQGPGVRELH
ncbi:MAG: hypothetical protein R3F62_10580 [Planctomycetota bacterium]